MASLISFIDIFWFFKLSTILTHSSTDHHFLFFIFFLRNFWKYAVSATFFKSSISFKRGFVGLSSIFLSLKRWFSFPSNLKKIRLYFYKNECAPESLLKRLINILQKLVHWFGKWIKKIFNFESYSANFWYWMCK